MKKISIYIRCVMLLATMLTFACAGKAEAEHTPSLAEQQLFDLINEARRDPLAMAGFYGLDVNQLKNDLPELSEIFINGLPSLILNTDLSAVSLSHTLDMLGNNYYSSTSPDGTSSKQRILNAGYQPIITGETLGGLSFVNYIDSSRAVPQIFKNMFLDELDSERSEPRNILNPSINEVGVGISSGTIDFGFGKFNVYLATSDFVGSAVDYDVLLKMEQQLVQLINQARVRPVEVAASLGLDLHEHLELIPDFYDDLIIGLPPLVSDARLFTAALKHSEEMVANDFYGHESLTGEDVGERIVAADYQAAQSGEILSRMKFSSCQDSKDAVQKLFNNMLLMELDPLFEGRRVIFAADMVDVGVGIVLGEMSDATMTEIYYVASCNVASPALPKEPTLMGAVYQDSNEDGLYNPGEGIAGHSLIYYDADLYLKTNEAGAVQHQVKSDWGHLVILFRTTEEHQFYQIFVEETNKWFDFKVNDL